jgi:hypothetical protein
MTMTRAPHHPFPFMTPEGRALSGANRQNDRFREETSPNTSPHHPVS